MSVLDEFGGYDMRRALIPIAVSAAVSLFAAPAENPADVEYFYAGEWHDCPEYAFSQPGRVAVAPTGVVFVIDENIQRLTEWTWCGSYKRAWKHLDEVDIFGGGNYIPADVAVGPDGSIYMTAYDEVRRYDAEGNFVGAWLVAGGKWDVYDHAWTIATGPGGDVYVLLSPPGCIRHYTPEGIYLGQWGSKGPGEGEFGRAFDMAVSPRTTHVYVADEGKGCVQYYTPTGSYLGHWGTPGSAPGQFGDSLSLAVGPDGTVFVADADNYRVQYFTAAGSYLGLVGCTSDGYRYNEFQWPTGIAVAPNGYVYVADRGLNRVFYYEPRAEDK
jgi:tripartite motif-containing protein 71